MTSSFWQPDRNLNDRKVAYFSMEIGIHPHIPTYSGGLGILAGDTIKSFADLQIPTVAVTLLSEKGYFYQKLSPQGQQLELQYQWAPSDMLALIPMTIFVQAEGRNIAVRAWEYRARGHEGYEVPIYFLDTNIETNSVEDRTLTSHLYGGDHRYRFLQEMILGVGGVRLLKALGFSGLERYHMNEGHAAFLIFELLKAHATGNSDARFEERYDVKAVREKCVFTTHTPVAAGHDSFPIDLARQVIGDYIAFEEIPGAVVDGYLHTTSLALHYSHYLNGVSKKHSEVSRGMFPGFNIHYITNGIHPASWLAREFQALFDQHFAEWRHDSFALRETLLIPSDEIWAAHQAAKSRLIELTNARCNTNLSAETFTIGFARRATGYKRPALLFRDIDRLLQIHKERGPIQIIFGGKAHPRDTQGKEIIEFIFSRRDRLKGQIEIAYLENYDMELGGYIVGGVDLWLNNPMPPLEASGTSGMKCAHNGIPMLSTLDGWWLEGHIEGITGWAIGRGDAGHVDDDADLRDMLGKLEAQILPLYYQQREKWIQIMKNCIAFNGTMFNTHRMVLQYVANAYFE